MKNKIEERFDPPFAYYKHAINGYVVRPLNWEGIWKDGFIFVGGNTMLNCSNEEDAKMITDTFNRFFDLLEEISNIKKHLQDEIGVANRDIERIKKRVNSLSGRSGGKTYLANELMKNSTAIRCFECTLDKIKEIEERIQEKYEN